MTFPVSSSIVSAPAIAAFVRETYALPGVVTAQLLRSGINDTYLVRHAEGQCVFRLYSLGWRTETEISEEIRLLELLRTNDIPVSYALPDSSGSYLQTIPAPEGLRCGVLFTFAPGKKQGFLPVEAHRQAGKVMAEMHALTQNRDIDRITYTPETLIAGPLREIVRFLPEATEEMRYLHRLGTHITAAFAGFDNEQLSRGIVHFDLWFDNMNVQEDGAVTVFDFDFCGNGLLCHDVAYYMLQLHNVERDETVCAEKLAAFFSGYASVRQLTDEERRILPLLGLSSYIFYLGVQCRRFENWSNTFLTEDYLKRFTNALIRRYADIHAIGAE